MNITTPPAHQLTRQVADRLAEQGSRYTEARRHIVDALLQADGPRSAAELAAALDHAVPVSSLYRNLAVLEGAGVVAPHHGAGGVTRFELSEALAGHHHHLVCIRCGQVEDVDLVGEEERALDSLVRSAGTYGGFQPIGHALEIEGVCRRCGVESSP